MLLFVTGMITIDVAQEWKTDRTLRALKIVCPPYHGARDGTREGDCQYGAGTGDIMVLCEGIKIPADGSIVSCSDFCVDESTLTGEPVRVWKHARSSEPDPSRNRRSSERATGKRFLLRGHPGRAGQCIGSGGTDRRSHRIWKGGSHVVLGRKGADSASKQTKSLVTVCAGIAALLFLLVSAFTYGNLSGYPFPGAADQEHFVGRHPGDGHDTGGISCGAHRIPLYGSLAAGQEAFPGASSAVGRDAGSGLLSLCG